MCFFFLFVYNHVEHVDMSAVMDDSDMVALTPNGSLVKNQLNAAY